MTGLGELHRRGPHSFKAIEPRERTKGNAMAHSNHGIVKDDKGQEQPADKARAQNAHKTDQRKPGKPEATRDPKLNDADKTPGSGMMSDDRGDPPSC
ncbi:hypothetical protein [Bradyrhizobium sp. UFLA03-84]|uniref:hypothetical protein n=1 Tax=Bradyrhizobium sp. UFLA03-84 TaxID=418599 RepID=UPI001FD951C1|nr:hypothetical protein [Bradyrhizobium sp. UFLA03-84]